MGRAWAFLPLGAFVLGRQARYRFPLYLSLNEGGSSAAPSTQSLWGILAQPTAALRETGFEINGCRAPEGCQGSRRTWCTQPKRQTDRRSGYGSRFLRRYDLREARHLEACVFLLRREHLIAPCVRSSYRPLLARQQSPCRNSALKHSCRDAPSAPFRNVFLCPQDVAIRHTPQLETSPVP